MQSVRIAVASSLFCLISVFTRSSVYRPTEMMILGCNTCSASARCCSAIACISPLALPFNSLGVMLRPLLWKNASGHRL
uniref:Putative secreted protein n=1 Tax=Anopheles marajoara TaxID=58244 RepID=A0A2M4CCE4_9DIPT